MFSVAKQLNLKLFLPANLTTHIQLGTGTVAICLFLLQYNVILFFK